ncbi:WD40 repeat domain-containing protein [Streptomyces sp. 110]|uniref:WD40 repeat domain-containing protein n=1 Tax=Streptomyces endocoffeicus TaxID=2898945 RepID=A0ABS1Q6T8_9ACTN|nr:WD40 repeat domain-containing protein [Streptomyces endocoffeicus]MBL1120069.1 WD40 repeat domain-containing protein [Streptomyces endocoffeicus]
MSTDMYGVRVLAVDPDELRARLKVFVVYYDVGSRTHIPLPNEEPNTFLHFLWEAASGYLGADDDRTGPLGHAVSTSRLLDYEWADTNARRFISRVERVELRNYPLTDDQWEDMHDFYYERGGAWKDEDLLIQAEYEIRVTDRKWLEPLSVGDGWGSAAFPLNGDSWTAEDSPHIPDLARPAVTLRPFETTTGSVKYDHVNGMDFSDDGKYLAVCSDQGRVWVYDTADWSEVVHTHAGDWIVPLMMWVPGGHVLVVKGYSTGDGPEERKQWAFDVDRRAEAEAPFQLGHLRSCDGAYRISPNGAGEGGFDLHGDEREPFRRVSHAGEWDPIQCTAFSGDSSRLFLGAQQNLYVVDPATGGVIDKVDDASERLFTLASNGDGSYLAVGSFSRKLSYLEFRESRPHELCVWRMADKKIILGRQMRTYVDALSWSPDNRWLAAALEPLSDKGFHRGMAEVAVFPMGPVDM